MAATVINKHVGVACQERKNLVSKGQVESKRVDENTSAASAAFMQDVTDIGTVIHDGEFRLKHFAALLDPIKRKYRSQCQ
jgi:hypothetical protein